MIAPAGAADSKRYRPAAAQIGCSAVLVGKHGTSQVTVRATVTASKPGAVAAIIVSEGLPGAGWREII